jgi:hypothetical protein
VKLSLPEIANVAPLPDLPGYVFQPRVIEVHGGQMKLRCAWCDEENNVRYVGNVSHRVCFMHLCSNLWFCLPKDSLDTLFYAVLCQLGEPKCES